MKRHEAFQDLSRDHYVALNHVVLAKRIQEGSPHAKPLAEVWAGFVNLWRELEPHFDEEEELLVPLLDGRAENHTIRLLEEHGWLRQAFAELCAMPEPNEAHLFNTAEALRVHARWEEAHVFEGLQKWLSEAELLVLDEQTTAWRLERRGPDSVGTGRIV